MGNFTTLSKSVVSLLSNPIDVLIHRRVGGLVFIALLALAAIASACGSDEPEILVYRGRSLELHLEHPIIAESMSFVDGAGQHRVLRPKASNRQLAMVNITVVNRTSTVTSLLVDTESAQIGDRRSNRINAINPFEDADVVQSPGSDEGKFTPMLWGKIELERNFQATGYMVFDVPKGLTLGSVWWSESDDIIADFIDYQRGRRP